MERWLNSAVRRSIGYSPSLSLMQADKRLQDALAGPSSVAIIASHHGHPLGGDIGAAKQPPCPTPRKIVDDRLSNCPSVTPSAQELEPLAPEIAMMR